VGAPAAEAGAADAKQQQQQGKMKRLLKGTGMALLLVVAEGAARVPHAPAGVGAEQQQQQGQVPTSRRTANQTADQMQQQEQ
jgi:hypothetical protein